LPPLRERGEDILLLAEHFASRLAIELNLEHIPSFSNSVKTQLMAYGWPGNVRECKNVIERAVYQSRRKRIDTISFDPFEGAYPGNRDKKAPGKIENRIDIRTTPLAEAKKELEYRYLREALKKAKHNQKKAAKILGMSYHQFRGLYRKYQDLLTTDFP
jgi:psp operon transcriptional activator